MVVRKVYEKTGDIDKAYEIAKKLMSGGVTSPKSPDDAWGKFKQGMKSGTTQDPAKRQRLAA